MRTVGDGHTISLHPHDDAVCFAFPLHVWQ